MGSTASGKTTKACELAAQSLRQGKSVLFVNDEEDKFFLREKIGSILFNWSGYARVNLKETSITFTNQNYNWLRGMSFDVVIFDAHFSKACVRDFYNYTNGTVIEFRQLNVLGYDEVHTL